MRRLGHARPIRTEILAEEPKPRSPDGTAVGTGEGEASLAPTRPRAVQPEGRRMRRPGRACPAPTKTRSPRRAAARSPQRHHGSLASPGGGRRAGGASGATRRGDACVARAGHARPIRTEILAEEPKPGSPDGTAVGTGEGEASLAPTRPRAVQPVGATHASLGPGMPGPYGKPTHAEARGPVPQRHHGSLASPGGVDGPGAPAVQPVGATHASPGPGMPGPYGARSFDDQVARQA
jgi:hypothetical protein